MWQISFPLISTIEARAERDFTVLKGNRLNYKTVKPKNENPQTMAQAVHIGKSFFKQFPFKICQVKLKQVLLKRQNHENQYIDKANILYL